MPATKVQAAATDSSLMVNSVHKAFRVLTAFDATGPRLTLSQIADKLGIDKSTAQRFTHTLVAMGYLDKAPVSKALGVTVKVLELAHIYLSTNPLVGAAMPYLMHLKEETGETVNLTVLDGGDVVFVSRLVGRHLLSTGVMIGTRMPAYTSAAGLSMLSTLGDAEIKHVLKVTNLKPYTPQTVYTPARIFERLKLTRTKGYAVSVGEYFLNDISVGAPIHSRSGQMLGAVSLAVSSDRYTAREAESRFARLVAVAAKSVVL